MPRSVHISTSSRAITHSGLRLTHSRQQPSCAPLRIKFPEETDFNENDNSAAPPPVSQPPQHSSSPRLIPSPEQASASSNHLPSSSPLSDSSIISSPQGHAHPNIPTFPSQDSFLQPQAFVGSASTEEHVTVDALVHFIYSLDESYTEHELRLIREVLFRMVEVTQCFSLVHHINSLTSQRS